MGSAVPAGVATPGTTAPDSAAMGAPTKEAPATGAAITEETVGATETQPACGRPAWLLPAFAGLAVVVLASWTLANWGMEETDNAQLQAEITQISSRVAGTIERVAAERDQAVAAFALAGSTASNAAAAELARRCSSSRPPRPVY